MYPHERSLIEQTAGKPFAIIGVNSDEDLDSIRQIAKSKNLTWRSFWDGDEGPIAKDWCITAWPTTYLIDSHGVIRHKHIMGDRLDRAIESLMEEAGHPIKLER
jgi:hypothetical protein